VSAPTAIHVVAVGHSWHGDDGFGCHVLRRLREAHALPPSVALLDAGVAGLNALGCFEGCAKAVVVDAVRVGAPVGSLHRLTPADLEPPGAELSLHALGVSGVLCALSALGAKAPEVVLVGAQVGAIAAFTDGLSAPLRSALPRAVEMVVDECRVAAPPR
jgi:hydrogenase maturation protease